MTGLGETSELEALTRDRHLCQFQGGGQRAAGRDLESDLLYEINYSRKVSRGAGALESRLVLAVRDGHAGILLRGDGERAPPDIRPIRVAASKKPRTVMERALLAENRPCRG